MRALDLAFLSLLGAAGLCSIIELGLSAYTANVTGREAYFAYDPNSLTGGSVRYRNAAAPSEVSFLVFCSIWSLLVTIILVVVPMFFTSRFNQKGNFLGIGTLVLTTLTMVFWLAGFAALASLYGGFAPGGILGALLAFAVIPWLIFLGLTILNFLTAFGVLASERRGHESIFKRRHTENPAAPMTTIQTPNP